MSELQLRLLKCDFCGKEKEVYRSDLEVCGDESPRSGWIEVYVNTNVREDTEKYNYCSKKCLASDSRVTGE